MATNVLSPHPTIVSFNLVALISMTSTEVSLVEDLPVSLVNLHFYHSGPQSFSAGIFPVLGEGGKSRASIFKNFKKIISEQPSFSPEW